MIQTVEQHNMQQLQQYDLGELTRRSTAKEINGEMVWYANLLVEKTSGKILNLTPANRVLSDDRAISTIVAIISSGFFSEKTTTRLELAQESDLPSSILETVKKSIQAFNEFLLFSEK